MKYSLSELNKYLGNGLLVKQTHPTLPLSIWNYSRECQYAGAWDSITTSCRGLVIDDMGNVIAKPFPKFFNVEELDEKDIPNEPFDVFSKMDGSLGIVFNYNSEWIVATKGSFVSTQSVKAAEMLINKYDVSELNKDYTYLFEIIFPANMIVCNYGLDEKLVLLSAYNTSNCVEIERSELEKLKSFELVKKYDGFTDYKVLKSLIKDNEEGFVIRFKNGFRMKDKGMEYVRLHKIVTNISTVTIWETLKQGKKLELDMIPDEFDKWVNSVVTDLRSKFLLTKVIAESLYAKRKAEVPDEERREYADWVLEQDGKLHPILFRIADDKTYDDIIWRQIRPEYARPIWDGEE